MQHNPCWSRVLRFVKRLQRFTNNCALLLILLSAYLRNANLRKADLRKAYLGDAILQGADLRDADLQNADFSYAVLSGRFGCVQWDEHTNWNGVVGLDTAIGVPDELKQQLGLDRP